MAVLTQLCGMCSVSIMGRTLAASQASWLKGPSKGQTEVLGLKTRMRWWLYSWGRRSERENAATGRRWRVCCSRIMLVGSGGAWTPSLPQRPQNWTEKWPGVGEWPCHPSEGISGADRPAPSTYNVATGLPQQPTTAWGRDGVSNIVVCSYRGQLLQWQADSLVVSYREKRQVLPSCCSQTTQPSLLPIKM